MLLLVVAQNKYFSVTLARILIACVLMCTKLS